MGQILVYYIWALSVNLGMSQTNGPQWQTFRNGRIVNENDVTANPPHRNQNIDISVEEFDTPSDEVNDFFEDFFDDIFDFESPTLSINSDSNNIQTRTGEAILNSEDAKLNDIAFNRKLEHDLLFGGPLKHLGMRAEMRVRPVNPLNFTEQLRMRIRQIQRHAQTESSRRQPIQMSPTTIEEGRHRIITLPAVPALDNKPPREMNMWNTFSDVGSVQYPLLIIMNNTITGNQVRKQRQFSGPNTQIHSSTTMSRDIHNGNQHISRSDFRVSTRNSSNTFSAVKSLPNNVRWTNNLPFNGTQGNGNSMADGATILQNQNQEQPNTGKLSHLGQTNNHPLSHPVFLANQRNVQQQKLHISSKETQQQASPPSSNPNLIAAASHQTDSNFMNSITHHTNPTSQHHIRDNIHLNRPMVTDMNNQNIGSGSVHTPGTSQRFSNQPEAPNGLTNQHIPFPNQETRPIMSNHIHNQAEISGTARQHHFPNQADATRIPFQNHFPTHTFETHGHQHLLSQAALGTARQHNSPNHVDLQAMSRHNQPETSGVWRHQQFPNQPNTPGLSNQQHFPNQLLGTVGQNFPNQVGTSGQHFPNQVGTSGQLFPNQVAISGQQFPNQVGTSGIWNNQQLLSQSERPSTISQQWQSQADTPGITRQQQIARQASEYRDMLLQRMRFIRPDQEHISHSLQHNILSTPRLPHIHQPTFPFNQINEHWEFNRPVPFSFGPIRRPEPFMDVRKLLFH